MNRNTKGQFVKGHSIVGNRTGTVGPWRNKKRPDMAARHTGEGNPGWKGDDLGVGGIHIWLRKTFGSGEGVCEHCEHLKTVEYALKTGYQYKRKRENFLRLCRGCHLRYDYANGTRKTRKRTSLNPQSETA